MPKSIRHIPQREVIAIMAVTVVVVTAALALLLKLGFGPLLIV